MTATATTTTYEVTRTEVSALVNAYVRQCANQHDLRIIREHHDDLDDATLQTLQQAADAAEARGRELAEMIGLDFDALFEEFLDGEGRYPSHEAGELDGELLERGGWLAGV